jgi:hypothetical protein
MVLRFHGKSRKGLMVVYIHKRGKQRRITQSLKTMMIVLSRRVVLSSITICLIALCNSSSIVAYTYNSYPYLYVNDKQPNSTYPIQEHIPSKPNDLNDRPDFIYNPKPGEYRVVEFYVHCTYRCL